MDGHLRLLRGRDESPTIGCTFSPCGDSGDGLRSLTLQMDPIPTGMSVAAARAAWRPLVDAQVIPGAQTLRALPGLGDEAYLITGSGAYASMAMLLFFAGGNSGMLQASTNVVADGNASAQPDPVIGDRLVRLAQIALPRFEAQLGTATSAPTPGPAPTVSDQAIDFLTLAEMSQVYGGTWSGGCTIRPVPHIACSFTDRADGTRGVVIHLALPESADLRAANVAEWHAQIDGQVAASPTEWQSVTGVGDAAYLHQVPGAAPSSLFFLLDGASGQIDTTVADSAQQLADIAKLIASRYPPHREPLRPSLPPAPTPAPSPPATPSPTREPTPAATPAPTPAGIPTPAPVPSFDDQLLTEADVSRVVGGDWPGSCTRTQRSVACQFAQAGGAARVGLSVDQPGPGTSVGTQTLEAWRQSVQDAAAATSATLTAVPDLGDEAYSLQGVGAYSLDFYAHGLEGRLDAADSTPAIDATLPGLARLALQRLGVAAPVPSPAPPPARDRATGIGRAGADGRAWACGHQPRSGGHRHECRSRRGHRAAHPVPVGAVQQHGRGELRRDPGWFRFRRRRARPIGDVDGTADAAAPVAAEAGGRGGGPGGRRRGRGRGRGRGGGPGGRRRRDRTRRSQARGRGRAGD